ncbi:30S ribosomal protein S18 [Candidatus Parcubacteria bacterium]|nr:30S ribosomal protein S18 [Candidatus Parcubacteria bacterium]
MITLPNQLKKECHFCKQNIQVVDYKDTELLRRFLTGQFKIAAPRRTGLCAKHQRRVATAIKRTRYLALLPYTIK